MDNLKIDGHKIHYHPERLARWLKGENVYPVYVEIGLTNACNHRCVFCALDYLEHKSKTLDTEVLTASLQDMGKHGVKSVMFSGEGEPLVHRDLSLLVEKGKESGLDISITCNGVLFSSDLAASVLPHLSWIKFSIDAGTPKTYAKIHGTKEDDFDVLMENIQNAVKIRRDGNYRVKIGTQLLLMEDNVREASLLAGRVKELGVDYLVVKPYSQHPDSINRLAVAYAGLEELKESLKEFKTDGFQVIFREETMSKLGNSLPYPVCHGLPFFTLIDASGNVIPCNMYYGKEGYYYGNLYEGSFSGIWEGERRKKVLEKMTCEGTENCRENCRLDSINRYLDVLKNPPEHVNFI
ncbi:MAG: radical SAM protein [bacterium]|nr:radical SAM protein [bacterium]